MHKDNLQRSEIDKFSQSASVWWDMNGPFKPLHDINPLRLAFIQQHTSLAGKAVLDVGCGGGILSESLARIGANVTGIDMSSEVLQVAKLHQLESGLSINYQKITVESLAQQQLQSFDVITCMELLEHVPDPASIIDACARLIRPGGQLFFSTINRTPKAYLLTIIGAEYILKMLPKGTHDYAKFIQPAELARWARNAKLRLNDIKGMTYQPLSKQFKLSNHVQANYLVCMSPV